VGCLLRAGGAKRSGQFSIARFFVVPQCQYVDGIIGRLITIQRSITAIAKADDRLTQLGRIGIGAFDFGRWFQQGKPPLDCSACPPGCQYVLAGRETPITLKAALGTEGNDQSWQAGG
jgi:hypothetical protein